MLVLTVASFAIGCLGLALWANAQTFGRRTHHLVERDPTLEVTSPYHLGPLMLFRSRRALGRLTLAGFGCFTVFRLALFITEGV